LFGLSQKTLSRYCPFKTFVAFLKFDPENFFNELRKITTQLYSVEGERRGGENLI
jgi:hypothetical protein